MQRIKIGTILYRARLEKNVSANILCAGLCQSSTMSYYESGKRIPDSLLFYYFMQRMGASSEDFAIMLNRDEYEYYIWKEKTWQELEDGEWNKLEQLLQEKEAVSTKCNERIQKQYYYYLKGILELQKDRKSKEGVAFLKMAAEQTIPDIYHISSSTILLGVMELNILINFLYSASLSQILNQEEAEKLFWILEQYISQGSLEKKEQAKVYPKLICIWSRICEEKVWRMGKADLCEKAVLLLKETYTLYDAVELLRIYAEKLKQTNPHEANYLRKQHEVIEDMFEQNGIDISFRPEVLRERNPKIYLMHEYLHMCRTNRNMTQGEISEGICEPESYSRLERGKRMPTLKNYIALEERLGIGWGYYRGELSTDNLKVYELRRKQREAAINEDWELDKKLLGELEAELDMSEISNYQYVKSKQNMAKYYLGELTEQEVYASNEHLLRMTVPADIKEGVMYYYSQTELEMITQMAIMLRKRGEFEEGTQLLESTLRRMRRSEVDIGFQWNGASFALRVLSALYFSQGRYEEALALDRYILSGDLRRMQGETVAQLLDAVADDLEHMGERYSDKYRKLYRQVYYIADFFKLEKIVAFSRTYYEELFGIEMD